MESKGAVILAEALKYNTQLATLELQGESSQSFQIHF